MDEMLAALKTAVEHRASLIQAPPELLPTWGASEGSGRPHIEREGPYYCYVVQERGQEFERTRTTSQDEILWWIFRDLSFSMAANWEVRHRTSGEDFRRGLFRKQMEILGDLDPVWVSRFRLEKSALLAEVGLT